LKTNEGSMTYECDNVNSVKISSESRIFYTFEEKTEIWNKYEEGIKPNIY
jgi:hypothetical protein